MNPRRTLLKLLSALGLLGPAGITGLIRNALAQDGKSLPSGLHKATGDVRVNGKPARIGTPIRSGDTVTTGVGSEAVYVIGQDAFLQRDQSSISFGTDVANGGRQLMRVLTGKILSVFGKSDRGITIVTSTATAGIRGTACYIEDEPGKVGASQTAADAVRNSKTYFFLCYGTVELVPDAAPNERMVYSTRHHEKPMLISKNMNMPATMASATVINHTDIELTLLEGLVGRKPPFDGSYGKAY